MDRFKATSVLVILVLACVGACSDGAEAPGQEAVPSPSVADEEPSESPTAADGPTTEVVACQIENGLPVAQVNVTNTTSAAGEFTVRVQFLSGESVLGEGVEFTSLLAPGQSQLVRMGNMQGDAPTVDECRVLEAAPFE